jgi:hypothetical protein
MEKCQASNHQPIQVGPDRGCVASVAVKTLTTLLLTAIAASAIAAEPQAPAPTEAQCHAFIRQYYAALDAPKSKPPTAAQIQKWSICTATYDSAMELSNRIIKQRQQARG